MTMPGMGGLTLAREIRKHRGEQELPLLLITSLGRLQDARTASEFAVQLAKPLKASQLFNALITVLADRAKEPEAPPVAADGVKPATSALRPMLRELGGDDFLGELIDTFLAEAPSLLATLRRALEQDEADEAQRAAHTLKSNGATFGAEDFSELCRELEARAKDGRLEGAEQLVDRIDEEYARLQEALAALRALP